jgi:predicted MFS family arabinose efflux permease
MRQQDHAAGEIDAREAGIAASRPGIGKSQPIPVLSRAVTLLLAVACGLAVANISYAQPLLDTLADDFGISHAAVGIIVTVTQIGYGLGLLLVVPLGDILDRRDLIVAQLMLSALTLVAVALAPTQIVLLGAVFAVGALSVVTQVMVAYAAGLAPPGERGRVVGVVTSGIITGILLARAVAGTLSDLLGWRSVYLFSAVATLVVTALLFMALPRQGHSRAEVSYIRLIGTVFMLFVEEPILRIRAILAFLIFFAITVLLTPLVLPLAAAPFWLSHTQIGLFGLAGAAGALGAAGAGGWSDRGFAQRTTGIALTLMLLSWFPIALLPYSLWGLIIGIVVIDFGLQAVHVANQSLIYRVRPEAQSRLTAGYMIFYSIGCATGSIVSTLVYAGGGWTGVCLLGAAASALALLFWMSTRRLG